MAEFRHIVRVNNTDLKGDKAIYLSMQKIKGIGDKLANKIYNCVRRDFKCKTLYKR